MPLNSLGQRIKTWMDVRTQWMNLAQQDYALHTPQTTAEQGTA